MISILPKLLFFIFISFNKSLKVKNYGIFVNINSKSQFEHFMSLNISPMIQQNQNTLLAFTSSRLNSTDLMMKYNILQTSNTNIQVDKLSLINEFLDSLSYENYTPHLFTSCISSLGSLFCTVPANRRELLKLKMEEFIPLCSYHELIKLMAGFSKIGLTWNDISDTGHIYYMNLLKSEMKTDLKLFTMFMLTLGQMNVLKKEFIYDNTNEILLIFTNLIPNISLNELNQNLKSFTKLEIEWKSFDSNLRSKLNLEIRNIFVKSNSDETWSLLRSLSSIKMRWNELSFETINQIIIAITKHLDYATSREISCCIWCVGKLNYPFQSNVNLYSKDLLIELIQRKFESNIESFTIFDLESCFVGFGLMEFNYQLLSKNSQLILLKQIDLYLPQINIFGLTNIVWGLARMSATKSMLSAVTLPSITETAASLSMKLINRIMEIFHTFLPSHYGDILYAFGTLGYTESDFTKQQFNRLLAILSRIYLKLDIKSSVYVLWGLSRMNIHWKTLTVSRQSIENGEFALPFSENLFTYLKQRVSSMKEHEYSILLYSLGELGFSWNEISSNKTIETNQEKAISIHTQSDISTLSNKIHNRMKRLSVHMKPRSISNSLYGLSKCNLKWKDIPSEIQFHWLELLLLINPDSGMTAIEISQSIYSLGKMYLPWNELTMNLQNTLINSLLNSMNAMTSYGRLSCLQGLIDMNCDNIILLKELILLIQIDSVNNKRIDFNNNRSISSKILIETINQRYNLNLKLN